MKTLQIFGILICLRQFQLYPTTDVSNIALIWLLFGSIAIWIGGELDR